MLGIEISLVKILIRSSLTNIEFPDEDLEVGDKTVFLKC